MAQKKLKCNLLIMLVISICCYAFFAGIYLVHILKAYNNIVFSSLIQAIYFDEGNTLLLYAIFELLLIGVFLIALLFYRKRLSKKVLMLFCFGWLITAFVMLVLNNTVTQFILSLVILIIYSILQITFVIIDIKNYYK